MQVATRACVIASYNWIGAWTAPRACCPRACRIRYSLTLYISHSLPPLPPPRIQNGRSAVIPAGSGPAHPAPGTKHLCPGQPPLASLPPKLTPRSSPPPSSPASPPPMNPPPPPPTPTTSSAAASPQSPPISAPRRQTSSSPSPPPSKRRTSTGKSPA